jgi:hypothetical protein
MAGNRARDVAGLKFGRLTALRHVGYNVYSHTKHAVWECVCECGAVTRVSLYCLTTGNTKSCGCLKADLAVIAKTTHGHASKGKRSPTWILWASMRNRKIGHDPAWDSFETFLSDMGERPEGLSLDRIDNAKGYSKANCRWVTPAQQARNRSITKMVEFEGETLPLAELAERFGLKYHTVHRRYSSGARGRDLVKPLHKWLVGQFVAQG